MRVVLPPFVRRLPVRDRIRWLIDERRWADYSRVNGSPGIFPCTSAVDFTLEAALACSSKET